MKSVLDIFDNPVIVASGCVTDSKKQICRYLAAGAGAVVTKTIYHGNTPDRSEITRHHAFGTFNTTLYSKRSVKDWVQDLDELYSDGARIITSIHAETPLLLGELASQMYLNRTQPFELGIACPTDSSHEKLTPELVGEYCKHFRRNLPDSPLTVKLSALNIKDLGGCITQAKNQNCLAIILSDSLPGIYFDSKSAKIVHCGYSGLGIKPIVQRVIAESIAKFPDVDFIGAGGINDANDVAEYLEIGCCAVQAYSSIAKAGPEKIQELLKWNS